MLNQGGAEEASDLMTIGEIALMAGVFRDAVDKAMRLGMLRYTRRDGRRMALRADAETWARTLRIVRVPSHWTQRTAERAAAKLAEAPLSKAKTDAEARADSHGQWFRFYACWMDDSRLQSVGDATKWFYFRLLCYLAKNPSLGGLLGDVTEASRALNARLDHAKRMLADLVEAGRSPPRHW